MACRPSSSGRSACRRAELLFVALPDGPQWRGRARRGAHRRLRAHTRRGARAPAISPSFLAGWELMTLLPAAAGPRRSHPPGRPALGLHLPGGDDLASAGTWIAVLPSAHVAGSFSGAIALGRGSGLHIAIALAALVGMGTKSGLMPFHRPGCRALTRSRQRRSRR